MIQCFISVFLLSGRYFNNSRTERRFVVSYFRIPFVVRIAMNKQAIAEAVHSVLGGTKVQAVAVVDKIIDCITGCVKNGEGVSNAGLGFFSGKPRPPRPAAKPPHRRDGAGSRDESAEVPRGE